MDNDIQELTYCLFDTETTGLSPQAGDRIVEIAAIRWTGARQEGQFHSLINPGRSVSAAAFAVNHITDQMLSAAPQPDAVLPKFVEFIRGACLCSYNLPFDLGFLNAELALLNQPPVNGVPMADILTMARRLLPQLESHSLSFVARHLGIGDEQSHRAFSDVRLAREVFSRLEPVMRQRGIAGVSSFLHLFGIPRQGQDALAASKLARIQEAIDQGLRLTITYYSNSSNALSKRQVVPKEIRPGPHAQYLVAFCCLKNEERTFRLDNIVELDVA